MEPLRIKTAEVFEPLLQKTAPTDEPVRYRGAYGGRGSGKSHFFAELLVEECYRNPGTRAVCVREVQKTLRDSSKAVIEEKIKALGLGQHFDVKQDRIGTRGDGVILFQGMQDHTAESIKSLEGMRLAWVEEAQTLSQRSLDLLRPTIRIPKSELWFSWNPRTPEDAVDQFLRVDPPSNAIVVKANWRDNPWWNEVLEKERLEYFRKSPWSYENIWEGEYGAVEGAYFAQVLAQAKATGRVGRVAADPILPMRAYFDIGGAGKHADATAIWIVQFAGREIRVIEYLEFAGQTIAFVANALRQKGYEQVQCVFPHDGINANNATGKRYVDHWRDAGFDCLNPIPNQGSGAAMQRVEAVRRVFPFCWFNETQCASGLSALANYHEKVDEQRRVGLGPEHDWSSHCFTGDTKVLTRYGMCQINSLPNQGDILTPCGFKHYQNPRVTRRNAQLVEVRFKDGLTVRCTPDHLFETVSGWKSAESLTKGSLIRSGLTPLRRILMAGYIVAGQVKDIGRAAARSCTGTFGSWPLALFPRAATSTIGMEAPTTTCLPIWSVSPRVSISPRLGISQRDMLNLVSTSRRPHAENLRSGTDQMRVGSGIAVMPSAVRVGLSGSASRSNALSAVSRSMRWFAKAAIRKFTAAPLARSLRIGNASSKMYGPRIIESVRRLRETEDVWCLTVPRAECFSLANGAVVHNCADAFGLMAICYIEPLDQEEAEEFRRDYVSGRNEITGY